MDDQDPDFMEEYMSGGYDITCADCRGSGKVQVVDYSAMSPELQERYEKACDEEMYYQAQRDAERRMGA
jgi:hypothetical protein